MAVKGEAYWKPNPSKTTIRCCFGEKKRICSNLTVQAYLITTVTTLHMLLEAKRRFLWVVCGHGEDRLLSDLPYSGK